MRPNANWIVGPQGINSAGAVIAGLTSWSNGAAAVTLTAGTPQSYQAGVITAAAGAVVPTIGRMAIQEVRGSVFFSSFNATARVTLGIAIYVSEQNSATPTWDVRDPLSVADAQRDDYYFLEAIEFNVLAAPTNHPQLVRMDLKIASALAIGGGQALHVTVAMLSNVANTCLMSSAFRTRIGNIN